MRHRRTHGPRTSRLPLKRPIEHASHTRTRQRQSPHPLPPGRWDRRLGRRRAARIRHRRDDRGAFEQLAATPLAEQLSADCEDWPDVIALCQRFQPAAVRDDPRGCYGNALRAAVELSILDAFGRLFGEPVSRVTQHFARGRIVRANYSRVRYSGVITAETPRKEARQRDQDAGLRLRPLQGEGRACPASTKPPGCGASAAGWAGGWTCGSMPTRPGTPRS